MKNAAFKGMAFTSQIVDGHGNPIVFDLAPSTTNRNPDLDRIITLYYNGEEALSNMDDSTLRQFGDTILAVSGDHLTHDKLMRASFWNDISGFVDEHGKPLPSFAPDERSQTGNETPSAEGKIRYLANIIIPSCVSTMVIYLRQKLNPDEPPITDEEPTIDPKADAFNLYFLLKKLPM